jgi:hypothetical protein
MVCEECGLDKPLVANRGYNIRRCLDCSDLNYRKKQREYYERNRDAVKARTTQAQADRLAAWVEHFKSIYGIVPFCQCCNKKLNWPGEGDDKSTSVHFDHRHGGIESIKTAPTKWFRSRRPTEENIKIFDDCDFGLLCTDCNRCLPTQDRGEWLHKALKYYEQTKEKANNCS